MKRGVIFLLLMSTGAAVDRHEVMIARGTFDVKVTPQPSDAPSGGPFGRLFLDKRFQGDFEGVGHGQMLAAETAIAGSGAYVALELVTGTLQGKRGSFILQHKGTMRQGAFAMDVTVVPDSGTGDLAGLRGAMTILIKGTEHSYQFSYSLQ